MNKSRVRKFVALGLLALPLIIVAALALAWGQSASDPPTAQAAGTGTMDLIVKGGKTGGCHAGDTADYCVDLGAAFKLNVNVTTAPAGGYKAIQTWIDYNDGGGLIYTKKMTTDVPPVQDCATEIVWPPSQVPLCAQTGGDVNHGDATGAINPPKTQYVGKFVELNMACGASDSVNPVTLVPLSAQNSSGAGFVESGTNKQIAASDSIVIHCVVQPTATETNTPVPPTLTPTRTNTPTATNTPAFPAFVKSPAVQNLWLTRQGTKIPPVQCIGPQGGDDAATFTMALGSQITGPDPKDPTQGVRLGAFEFEVNYDANKVCVDITPGLVASSPNMTCFVEDSVSKPTLEGVARIGCVTIGKKINVNGNWTWTLLGSPCTLALVENPKGTLSASGQCVTTLLGTFPIGFSGPYNNQTGALNITIPCAPPLIGLVCTPGVPFPLVGTFNATGTTFLGKASLKGALVDAGLVPASLPVPGTKAPPVLATLTVYPQPDLYSQGKTNQDNGNVVQLTNKKCELADDQGHPIQALSCDDADVTIRYLEGDVEPDCIITSADTQAIAFRWGSSKGSLVYNDRFNLEPSGTQADSDIDIKDLQFVYGRFGSTCTAPWPAQPPVNPKI